MAVVMHRTNLEFVNNWENSGKFITMPGKKPFNVHIVIKPPLILPYLCRNIDRYSRVDFANRP